MPFKTPGANSIYIRSILPPEKDGGIKRILDYADANIIPVLLPETSAFLKQMVYIKQPKKILEIGTAIGYSGHIILGACSGHLYTIEADEKSLSKANEFFEASGYKERVTAYLGDANEIVPFFSGEFDFIFLDGPKTRYIQYLPYLKRMMSKGGILLCDNVLFNGMVSGEAEVVKKKATIVNALDLFLKTLAGDDDFITSVLPVGDGVSLSIKKD
ncbi:MAG: O-methyltransferase [Clostridiales bacterium]|nr:O-methyltransferase [Clostridiales bacterium]